MYLSLSLSAGLSSVEAYNPKANEWVFVAPMNTRRSSVGVGVVDGEHFEYMCVSAHHIEVCNNYVLSGMILQE